MDATRHGRPRHPHRRGRAGDRRWRREHVAARRSSWARPSRRSRATCRLFDTTIGWRFVNPSMKAALRRRFDAARPPTTSPPTTTFPARIRTPSPCASQQRCRRQGRRASSPKRSSQSSCRQGQTATVVADDEHPRAETTLEKLWRGSSRSTARTEPLPPATPRASTTVPARCCWHPRRRPGARPDRARPRPRHGQRRCPPRVMGIGPVPPVRKAAAPCRPGPRRYRRDRTQRGLRQPGAGGAARSSACRTTRRRSTRTVARSPSAIRWA